MSNKSAGNAFERQFAETLADNGYWVHLFQQNADGQPCDVVACKNNMTFLIDCKVVSGKQGFRLSRIEENQASAMNRYIDCGNEKYSALFAIQYDGAVYMFPYLVLAMLEKAATYTISPANIKAWGIRLEDWMI